MRTLNGIYAQYYRKSIGNRGYVFQDRYKSIVTQDQNYIEELIRYVHLNPLRAGICSNMEELDNYKWCGHSSVMGTRTFKHQNTTDILKKFSNNKADAVIKYRNFIQSGIGLSTEFLTEVRNSNEQKENVHNSGCWVIGDNDFVRNALKRNIENKIRLATYIKEKISLTDIATVVAKKYGISLNDIFLRGKNNSRSEARKELAKTARFQYGIPVIEIADFLKISSPSVSEMLRYDTNSVFKT
jgi:hypothetical protein